MARPSLKGQRLRYSLGVVPDAGVDVEDVVADEPDQVGEVGHRRHVPDELQHRPAAPQGSQRAERKCPVSRGCAGLRLSELATETQRQMIQTTSGAW